EPPHWMRFPVEFLVLACIVVGTLPALTIGPFLEAGVRAVTGPETPYYSLAVWHGFTLALLMSVIALLGGVTLYLSMQNYLKKGDERPPLLPRLRGQRIFENILVTISWRWARGLERLLGSSRLQPQLRLIVVAAILAGAWPIWIGGFFAGTAPAQDVDLPFLLLWILGGVCAIGAAWQAKFHRLVALIPMS